MEAKLELLRRTMDVAEKSGVSSADGRWKSASSSKPLTKGYVKSVLEAPKSKKAVERRPEKEAKTPTDEATPVMSQLLASPEQSPEDKAAKVSAALGGAASNLQAALQHQDRDALEVEAFLCSLKLERYMSLFMEHGFDCMDVVKEMEEQHMQQLGMAAGHVLKLRKRLTEMKPAKRVELGRKVSFTSQAAQEASPQKQEAMPGEGQGTSVSNLLEGHFSEEDSAASFQEALMAWRQGNKAPEVTAPDSKAGSFWASLGDHDVNLERASTPAKLPVESQGAGTADAGPVEERLCCYQCFKQFYAQYAVERADPSGASPKRLCSEVCGDAWASSMQAKMEALKERQQQLQQMQEMQRSLDEDPTPES